MRILSQSKGSIAFTNSTSAISLLIGTQSGTTKVIAYGFTDGAYTLLGEYATEERAKEVLMEIFQNKTELYVMPDE